MEAGLVGPNVEMASTTIVSALQGPGAEWGSRGRESDGP